MGYRQVYKGNSELKQYYLVNDFSGGINTSDVDSVISDREFRDLLNVELAARGNLQNRKGFGNLHILNRLIWESGESSELQGKLGFAKIVKDTNNTLRKLTEFETLEDFKEGTKNEYLELEILLFIDNSIKVLELYSFKNSTSITVLINDYHTFDEIIYKDFKVTPRTVDYADKVYLSLSDISENLTGIMEYTISKRAVRIIDSENCYSPTPREVTGSVGQTGFNVLSKNPLINVAQDNEGMKRLLGAFITDAEGRILTKIPVTDSIKLHILKSGNVTSGQLKITFKDHKDEERIFESWSSYEQGGYLVYEGFVDSLGADYITIDIEQLRPSVTVDSVDELYPYQFGFRGHVGVHKQGDKMDTFKMYFSTNTLPSHKGDFKELSYNSNNIKEVTLTWILSNKTEWDNKGVLGGPYDVLGANEASLPKPDRIGIVARTTNYDGTSKYYESAETFRRYGESKADILVVFNLDPVIFDPSLDGQMFYIYRNHPIKVLENVEYQRSVEAWQYLEPDEDNILVVRYVGTYKVVDDLEDICISLGALVEVKSPETHYMRRISTMYVGELSYAPVDYNKNDIFLPLLGQMYEVGSTATAQEITSVDLKDAKITLVGDRLVYYKGNTIWFSELGQFDYLPNVNYILLPLQSNDEITHIAYFRNSHIIFTKDEIYKMSGTFETDEFRVQQVNEYIGCIAPKSVRSINNSLYFLSNQGLYQLLANSYSDGLENVKKVDLNIKGVLPIDERFESLLYNSQYWLTNSGLEYYDTLKCYYDLDTSNRQSPFVVDKYRHSPDIMFSNGVNIYALKGGEFYIYDLGYTDFKPFREFDDNTPNYTYPCKITTINYDIGYPTHNKKFKNIYIKTQSDIFTVLNLTLKIDDYTKLDPYTYDAFVNKHGEIEYVKFADPDKPNNLNMGYEEIVLRRAVLGSFELGKDLLGDNGKVLHKVTVPGNNKGKTVALMVEHQDNGSFKIEDIGFLYKLGKVKESRR